MMLKKTRSFTDDEIGLNPRSKPGEFVMSSTRFVTGTEILNVGLLGTGHFTIVDIQPSSELLGSRMCAS